MTRPGARVKSVPTRPLTAKQKQLMEDEFASRKAFEDYLAKLTD